MEAFMEFLSLYKTVVIIAAIVVVTAIFFIVKKDELGVYWLRFVYGVPLFGKSKRLAKNFQKKELGNENWFNSEDTLCGEFLSVYNDKNEGLQRTTEEYEICKDYLGYAGESARKLSPWWLWPLLVLVFVIEAAGFGYVFASYASPDASENTQLIMAYGFAAMLSGAAVFLTKKAGFELYKNSVKSNIRSKQTSDFDLRVTHQNIRLDESNESDKPDPIAIRILNRVEQGIGSDVRRKFHWTISTAIAVLLLAALAIGVRFATLERSLTEDQQMMQFENSAGAYMTEDPYGNGVEVPQGLLTDNQDEVQDTTVTDIIAAERAGGVMTYIAFGVVYILLQIVGAAAGYVFGFVGVESEKAFKVVNKFINSEQYVRYYEQERLAFEAIAQNHLNAMQKMLGDRAKAQALNSDEQALAGNFANRNYARYVVLKDEAEFIKKRGLKENTDRHAAAMQAPVEPAVVEPITNQTPEVESVAERMARLQAEAKAQEQQEAETLEQRMARLQAEAEEQKAADEQNRLANMSDEELLQHMRDTGQIS